MTLKSVARKAAYQLGFAGLYFRLVEWRLSRGREQPPAADENGVPIPSPYLMTLVVGNRDWRDFLASGESAAKTLADCSADAGAPLSRASRLLDFGCGCGRVIRHMPKHTSAELCGVDYNPTLAGWCAKNLKGDFRRNQLRPPLDFPDAHFDALYLLSVFTHLRIETQREWLREFYRVLRPGGVALVTFHDEDHFGFPDTDAGRAEIKETGVYIHNNRAEGSNLIATFQSRDFSSALFGEKFEVLRVVPSRDNSICQAIAILRKPAP